MLYLFMLSIAAALIIQHPRFIGSVNEGRIQLYLKELDLDENYIVLHNITLPTLNGQTTQIDHIILSIYGIFVIEAKSYKSFGEKTKQYWITMLHHLNGQIEVLERLLGSNHYTPIVILNPISSLNNFPLPLYPTQVTYDYRLMRVIYQFEQRIIPKEELVKLEYILLKNMI